jgi:rod shape-determining protein MreC
VCFGLIFASSAGVLSPVEGLLSIPVNFVTGILNRVALALSNGVTDIAELQYLRERNAELEETLALFQSELVELREIESDYQRLAELANYLDQAENQTFVTADVINIDQVSFLKTIVINRGTRDNVAPGMPVVTNQGLVGRVTEVSAEAARVQLITDPNSAISARLQSTRVEGSVVGTEAGNLVMELIPLGAPIQVGDIVLTSGLGGNLPSDIPIGQVVSQRQLEFALNQEAEIRSLVNFDTLELVLVITSFRPIDISIFDEGQ